MSHPFSAARLRVSASFVRLTGVSVVTFDGMLKQLAGPWEKVQLRKAKPGRPWDVGDLEDHLLIMLIYYRCYITQEFLGFFYNVNKSAICRAIKRIEKLARPLIENLPYSRAEVVYATRAEMAKARRLRL